jgi:hypothetical protein
MEVYGNAIMACISKRETLQIRRFATMPTEAAHADASCFGMEDLKQYISTNGHPIVPNPCCIKRGQAFRSIDLRWQAQGGGGRVKVFRHAPEI